MLEYLDSHHEIERVVGEGQIERGGLHHLRLDPAPRLLEFDVGQVEADEIRRRETLADCGQLPALTAADFQHTARRSGQRALQRRRKPVDHAALDWILRRLFVDDVARLDAHRRTYPSDP